MTPADRPHLLGLYDGCQPAAALVVACGRLGLDLLPYVECMPFTPLPRLLAGPVNGWRLALGLSADFAGLVELAPGIADGPLALWQDCVDAVAAGGIAVSLTAAAAYGHDIPCPFIAALSRRFPDVQCLAAMELALYEALANAIIHGNLGIDSSLRASAAGLHEYRVTLAHALKDPARANLRVVVTCRPVGDMLRLAVRDQGAGWDVDTYLAAAAAAKSGRGVDLIRQVAKAVRSGDGGRQLVMDFAR